MKGKKETIKAILIFAIFCIIHLMFLVSGVTILIAGKIGRYDYAVMFVLAIIAITENVILQVEVYKKDKAYKAAMRCINDIGNVIAKAIDEEEINHPTEKGGEG